MNRAAFILRGALVAGATGGLGAVGPFVSRALAQGEPRTSGGGTDVEVLQFALVLERLEAGLYERALREVPRLGDEARELAETLLDSERRHAERLEEAIRELGGRAETPRFDFGGGLRSERSFLRLAQRLEDTGVSAYNGAGPQLQSRELLADVAGIVQVEARHAAVIRLMRDEPVSESAFDDDLKMVETNNLVAPYVR